MVPRLARPAGPRRALVIGGSISGLFAALVLARRGWHVEVFERSETALSGRGAGIVTHPEFAGALAAAGLDPHENLGVRVDLRRTLDRAGRRIAEILRPQTVTSWDRIHSLLRERLPPGRYHAGRELVSIGESKDRVRATFSDGGDAEGDLLVGADGIRSTVRAHFLPGSRPVYAGYAAWRALVPESDFSPRTHADLFEYFTFCLPPGEQMLGYPVSGPDNDLRPGHRRYNFVWYRPAAEDSDLKDLLTDSAGRTHELSIPPPLIRAEVLADLRAAAERVLAPQFVEIVHRTPQPFLQPIYDLAAARMAFGRVALIGDAAFVARPHVGAGVVKAAQDAMTLADELDRADVEDALRAFERERLAVGRRIMAQARKLGAFIRPPGRAAPPQLDRAAVDRLMSETAVLDFLRT